MDHPRPSFVYFWSNKQYKFYNKLMRKMTNPVSGAGGSSNQQPLEHKFSTITTRPGLQAWPIIVIYLYKLIKH